MSLEKVFDSPYHKRIFFAAVVLFFVFLVVVRYLLAPSAGTTPSQVHLTALAILDNFTVGFFATVLLSIVVYYFRPRSEDESKLRQINANDIVPNFEKALADANRWVFKGNRGRYLRSKIFPSLSQRTGAFSIEAIFINPFNEEICRKFAEHKNVSILNEQGSDWDARKVQADLIATLVVSSWFKRFPSLSINIYLNNVFEPIRMDSNSKVTFLTVENKREPCLVVYDSHFLNQWMLDQFTLVKHQTIEANLNKINKPSLSDIDIEDVKEVCRNLGHEGFSEEILQEALKIAKANENPYG